MKNEPKIRIKGFEGEWKETTLSDIATFSKGHGYSKNDLTNEKGSIPIILYGRMYTKYEAVITEVDTFAYLRPNSVLSEGNEVIVPGSGETAEDISIASAICSEGIIIGGDLNILKPNKRIFPPFLALNITNSQAHYELSTKAQGKTIVHLHNNDFKDVHISFPSLREQHAIATYFRHLDSLIETADKKLASLKQVKETSLQTMFPQEGQSVPKVRFKGFEGEWKKSPFSEVFMFLRNNSLSRAELNYKSGLAKDIHYGDVLIKFGEVINVNKETIPYINDNEISKNLISNGILEDGDIIFSDAAEDETVGKCSELYNVGNNKIVSGLHTVPCRPVIEFASCYLGFYLNSKAYHNQLLPLIQGSKVSSLSKAAFINTYISYPKDLSEQRKLASFFVHLDKQIEIAQQRLALLRRIKSACLDEMFV